MKIGYVGLGAMGGSLVRWMIPHHEVTVFDLSPDAVAACVALGARAATSLTDLARACDVVFLCLPRSANVAEALFGNDGLAEALTPGTIVVDQTSGMATDTRAFAKRLAERGIAMLDAPVAGGVPSAQAGTITIMVSGPTEALDIVQPAFRCMTAKIYHASEAVGDAQAVKTLNNMMNMVMRVATLELTALAVKQGAALPALTEALIASEGANFTTRTVLPALVAGRSVGDFRLALMLKDNNQALALGTACNVPMPLSALGRAAVQQNIHITGAQAGLDEVNSYMQQVCGVRFDAGAGAGLPEADFARLSQTIATTLAACNRAAFLETLSVARALGMDLRAFGDILNNGSAWSRESEAVLAEVGGAPCPRTLTDAITALRAVEDMSVATGVPLMITGAVRALFETAQKTLGADAAQDQLARVYETAGGVSLRLKAPEPA